MRHTLFVPSAQHRDALLGEGIGGARPPVAESFDGGWNVLPSPAWGGRHPAPGLDAALILCWNGDAADEGCDRLTRAVNAARVAAGKRPVWRLEGAWDTWSLHSLADDAEAENLGTVTLVEE